MTLTASVVDVALALQQKLVDNAPLLGLQEVYYGDQDRIPTTPVACVEPNNKTNSLKASGISPLLMVTINVDILLYIATVGSPQWNRQEADRLGESVEALLHTDRTLGGTLIFGYVTSVNSGYANKSGSIIRACRITYEGMTQNQTPIS